MRYQLYPVANAECDSLNRAELLDETDELFNGFVGAYGYLPFGVGILDNATGLIDFGHGFGVPIEALNE